MRLLAEHPCVHDRRGRFCSKCGQDLAPPPLTVQSVMQDFSALWLQRGFRHTLLGLCLAPGRQIRRYIERDRSLLIKPASYLLVVAALYLWVLSLTGTVGGEFNPANPVFEGPLARDPALASAVLWLFHHFYYVNVANAFVMALMLRFVFYPKSGLTQPEYAVVTTYVLAQNFLLQIFASLLLLPFGLHLPQSARIAIDIAYAGWAIGQLHGAANLVQWIRAYGSYVVALLVNLAILLAGIALWDFAAGGDVAAILH